MNGRATIVAALAAIEGLHPTQSNPDTPTEGAAWPVWVQSTVTGNGKLAQPLTHTYEVYCVLPAGYHPDTVDKADGLIDQLAAALRRIATLQQIEPVAIAFDTNQTMPGIRIRLTPRALPTQKGTPR